MLNNILGDVFSLGGLVAFALGVALSAGWHHVKDRVLDRIRPNTDGTLHDSGHFNVLWVAWAAIILTIGFIGYQTERTWNYTRNLASTTADCQSQFNKALAARSQAIDESDRLATIERNALHDWITSLLSPPADIAALSPEDPRRQQWGIGVTLTYNNTVNNAEAQRAQNDAFRAANPLPQPVCGK